MPLVCRHADGGPARLVESGLVAELDELRRLIAGAEIVVSLLRPPLQAMTASLCVVARRPLVTTSYISEEIVPLDGSTRAAAVPLLFECSFRSGVNPLLAMREIDRLRSAGETITAYRSCAGGTPAPESNDNPWGDKFSWPPRGVLNAALQPARRLVDGFELAIPAGENSAHGHPVEIPPLGTFDAYPGRDAVQCRCTHGLSSARAVPLHGALSGRLPSVASVNSLRSAAPERRRAGAGAHLCRSHRTTRPVRRRRSCGSCRHSARVEGRPGDHRAPGLLGMFDDEPLPPGVATAQDCLLARMSERLAFRRGGYDVVVVHHDFEIERYGSAVATESSTLVDRNRIGKRARCLQWSNVPRRSP